MSEWRTYAPVGGWMAFTQSNALIRELWNRLHACDWHYMSFGTDSSAWESRRDGSFVAICLGGEQLVELAVQNGDAVEVVAAVAARFGLALVSE